MVIVEKFIVKTTIFFCENLILVSRWTRGLGVAHLRVTSLSCVSLFFPSFFHSLFFLKNVSYFPFFLYFFQKNVSLLALVSGFNCGCFLRSRCSTEMWCQDDIGRDSWDWVGLPSWERACFKSPEWGGGSTLVKTEPLQMYQCLFISFHGQVHNR